MKQNSIYHYLPSSNYPSIWFFRLSFIISILLALFSKAHSPRQECPMDSSLLTLLSWADKTASKPLGPKHAKPHHVPRYGKKYLMLVLEVLCIIWACNILVDVFEELASRYQQPNLAAFVVAYPNKGVSLAWSVLLPGSASGLYPFVVLLRSSYKSHRIMPCKRKQ